MSLPATVTPIDRGSLLRSVERRVLWLATAMVDHANRVRRDPSGLKVGGHQASSASMTTIMTCLWFDRLGPEDRVSVKPHASPVLHAINFLLGQLDEADLTTLRAFGGLQSYPSRTKDRGVVDYSTGSVGIGATAPLWGTLARRYVADHGGTPGRGRQYSLVGDAELDEGAVWEAVSDPLVRELGEVVWIVDLNRQSLDRVLASGSAARVERMFEAAGWQVIEAKYGTELRSLFALPGGEALRDRIDQMDNPEYQRLLRCRPDELRSRLADPAHPGLGEAIAPVSDERLWSALRDLGGHDPATLLDAFDRIDDTRPTVIVAYTVKGHQLASAGHPQNHSALLTPEQLDDLAGRLGADRDRPFAGFGEDSQEAELCRETARRLSRPETRAAAGFSPPSDFGWSPRGLATTQSALGRVLLDLARSAPEIGGRVVTVSPDVSSSTNLGGWVNKVGVWAPTERSGWFEDDPETILHWRERPSGQHIELGIAETNLVGLLGELGATWSRWGEALIPIGVVYDPFVGRALEPWSFGVYAGGQSILVGTPSGVSLAPEGGAHQSIITPSIGLEQPGVVAYEPAFAVDTEWVLLECIRGLGRASGTSSYLRLSTRPVDQRLADLPEAPEARELRRRQVVAGGYRLRPVERPDAVIATMGAVVPEALAAADQLAGLGVAAEVLCVTSPGLLFSAAQARRRPTEQVRPDGEWILRTLLPEERKAPLVTVLDGHPHALSFLAGVQRVPSTHLGVTRFGQSGDLASVYQHHGIDSASIAAALLELLPR